ncbi:predicted protein [Postia placenta Mad-698-R]|nr:predicted protein [Postia placenta Mad-698-R]
MTKPSQEAELPRYPWPFSRTTVDKQLHQAIDGLVAGTEPFREAKSPRSPYTFGRIPYAELPQQASRYLFTLGNTWSIAAEQYGLVTEFFRALAIVDKDIVDRHRASRGILRPHTGWQKALRLNAAGIRHNAAGLLLERMRIVQDFVVYFDALVWWEVHYNNTYVDPDIVRNTVRNIMLNPVLDYADAALADVRGLVEGECTERLETYILNISIPAPRKPAYPDSLHAAWARGRPRSSPPEARNRPHEATQPPRWPWKKPDIATSKIILQMEEQGGADDAPAVTHQMFGASAERCEEGEKEEEEKSTKYKRGKDQAVETIYEHKTIQE